MTWIPPDIAPLCTTAQGNLTQCAPIGFAYLALLAQLFGKPMFDEDPRQNTYSSLYTSDDLKNNDHSDNMPDFKKKSTDDVRFIYDFIIVGAGSAGCVLANRLSEIENWQILLLEAGEEEPNVTSIPAAAAVLINSNIDWAYKTEPDNVTCLQQKDQICVWPRGKTMGGSSAINYMTYMRGHRVDYDDWAADGNEGWSYKEVLPYFEKSISLRGPIYSKRLHGIRGPLNVERFQYTDEPSKIIVEAFQEMGIPLKDLGLESKVGVDINLTTSKDGKRQSTNVAFIEPIRRERKNLHIITNALATKILMKIDKNEAHGIEYYKDGKKYQAYARKEVIISAGSIDSPKLLKVSGIGPREELESLNIPVIANLRVGYNLQDHVTTDGLLFSLSNNTSTLTSNFQLLRDVLNYYKQPEKKNGPLATTSIVNSVAYYNTNGTKNDAPNIQFHFDSRRLEDFVIDPETYIATNIFPFSYFDAVAVRPILLTPQSRGVILLNRTDPIFGPPIINSGIFQKPQDLEYLVNATKFVIRLEDTQIFRDSGISYYKLPLKGCEQYAWGTDAYIACLFTDYTTTIAHPVGTCKMGPAYDKDAVVDPRFRVHKVKRLRVIDSSTMSKIIRGNTNAPTIMMAEKGADMIKEDHNIRIVKLK
ncbi:unnamed protein product [Leptosia nina]|uniref:Glucose-methanol-choline oxidoreductase N-terminal domain-containing protein n=1 Tax=Leptosia nina TaxID=320188 RepID=A0AAV1JE93_9NEOP